MNKSSAIDAEPALVADNKETPESLNKSTEPSSIIDQENQKILTPFAFEIDKSLFGLSLASPWRRACALMIDIFLIAVLSDAPGELLALVVAITLFKLAGRKYNAKGNRVNRGLKTLLNLVAAVFLFLALSTILPWVFDKFGVTSTTDEPDKRDSLISINEQALDFDSGVELAVLSAQYGKLMASEVCTDTACWYKALTPLVTELTVQKARPDLSVEFIDLMVDGLELADTERSVLRQQLMNYYHSQLLNRENNGAQLPVKESSNSDQTISSKVTGSETGDITQAKENPIEPTSVAKKEENKPVYSIIAWVKGIINDLGLGFGWAALYFTVFTALWHGQTPGKRLFKIRVLQLDGSPLSLWDSFGRYGGYGAGIATGLLGFIQIFWDANRQAIHDKISSTVVINKSSH